MKKNKSILSLILVLALSAAFLLGCSPLPMAAEHPEAVHTHEEPALGGVLCLKVNPEIALHYDENGKVTKLEARNADGAEILKNFTGYEGKETSQVLEALVEVIGKAGYFVEEADGNARKIVLELDPGSQAPHDKFLEDMAAHVKKCVENNKWVGETEFEYEARPVETTPAAPTTPAAKPEVTLCPVCGDDDCDDGIYCDDADEKAENEREQERRKNGTPCPVCADYDCDDGIYCDDADEREENLREEERRNTEPTAPKPTTPKPTTPETKPATPSTKPEVKLCPVCGDDDCDDGIYCDDADEKAENEREQENRKNGTPCPVCADYDCDDGIYCDDADEREENLREEERRNTEPSTPKPTTPETKPASPSTKPEVKLCPVCGDDDCDDGIYCDDADEREENLREEENRKNGVTCPVCGDHDCDDGEYCDDWDERYEDDDD